MHSVVPMRIAKISHVVLSLLLFAIGIVLVVKPTLSVTFLEKFCEAYCTCSKSNFTAKPLPCFAAHILHETMREF